MILKLKVEQRHIDNGVRHSPHCCPVANAASEAMGMPVIARHGEIFFCIPPGNMVYFKGSTELYNAMVEFDDYGTMEPGEWEFELC